MPAYLQKWRGRQSRSLLSSSCACHCPLEGDFENLNRSKDPNFAAPQSWLDAREWLLTIPSSCIRSRPGARLLFLTQFEIVSSTLQMPSRMSSSARPGDTN